jgi:hypothetical protein
MNDIKKPKLTAEQKLNALLAKQKLIADKAAALKRAISEKNEVDLNNKKLKFGALAHEVGVLYLSESIIRKALIDLAKANGVNQPAATPEPTPKPAVIAEVHPTIPANPEVTLSVKRGIFN